MASERTSGDAIRPAQSLMRRMESDNVRGRMLGRVIAFVYLVYVVSPIVELFKTESSPWRLLLALAGVALFIGVYAWGTLHIRFQPRRELRSWLLTGILAGVSVALCLTFGPEWLGLFLFATAFTGWIPLKSDAIAAAGACIGLMALIAYLLHQSTVEITSWVFQTALLFAAIRGIFALIGANRELRLAQEEIERLAIAEERARFARDLHDLLGHSLSVIVLKSELAGRLAPVAPERAATEIGDIEQVAREALREVRDAVAGYRQPALTAELARARSALAAAGIDYDVDVVATDLSRADEAVLAWAVREGVTNVVRHSRARHGAIRIETSDDVTTLEITDDGSGADPSTAGAGGSGLPGLAERVANRDGFLDAGPLPDGGFRLRVTLPRAQPPAAVPAGAR